MMGSMMRRAAIAGGAPKRLLSDLVAGTGYVDFVVVGDSNAGNFDSVGARGYAGGLSDALDAAVVKEYSTAFGEQAAASLTYPRHGAPYTTPNCQFSVHTSTTYGTTWSRNYNGTALRINTLEPYWKPHYLKIDGVLKDFSYLESTSSQAYSSIWMKLNHNAASIGRISVRDALTVRFHYGALPHTPSTAQVSTWLFLTAGGTVAAAQTSTLYNTTGNWFVTYLDRTVSADAARTEMQCTTGANTVGKGPVAFLGCSAFKTSQPGYGIQIFTNHSGSTSTAIKDALSDASGCGTSHIYTYLSLLAQRQLSASNGTAAPRVMVWLNFGINDGTANATANYVSNASAIVAQFKAAWQLLGYSEANLGFLLSVSHPTPTFNPSGATAAATAAFANDPSVRFVDISTTYTNWTPAYSGVTDAHLTQTGYQDVVSNLIAKVLA